MPKKIPRLILPKQENRFSPNAAFTEKVDLPGTTNWAVVITLSVLFSSRKALVTRFLELNSPFLEKED